MAWYIERQHAAIAILDDVRPANDRVVCHLPAVYIDERERSEKNAELIIMLHNSRLKSNESMEG